MIAILASTPELPLHTAVKYVAGAYAVFVVLLLIYLAIMAKRLRTTEQDIGALRRELDARAGAAEAPVGPADSIGSSADAELPGVRR